MSIFCDVFKFVSGALVTLIWLAFSWLVLGDFIENLPIVGVLKSFFSMLLELLNIFEGELTLFCMLLVEIFAWAVLQDWVLVRVGN